MVDQEFQIYFEIDI